MATLMYKYVHGYVLPYLQDSVTPVSHTREYNLRKPFNLVLPRLKTEFDKRSFRYDAAYICGTTCITVLKKLSGSTI